MTQISSARAQASPQPQASRTYDKRYRCRNLEPRPSIYTAAQRLPLLSIVTRFSEATYSTLVPATMKVSAILFATASAASVSAGSLFSTGGDQAVINEDFKVPGDNPLYFCADPKDYLLDIENVDLEPNPPVPYVSLMSIHELETAVLT